MWTRKHVLFGVGALILLEVCVQLLFPYDRALPLAKVGQVRAGFSSRSDLARIFQEQFEQAKVEIASEDKTIVSGLGKLGASLNNDQMAVALTAYPLWQRFIPFSLVVRQPRVMSFQVILNGQQVEARSHELATQLSYDPTDAAVSFKDGQLVVGTAHAGRHVEVTDVTKMITGATYYAGTTKLQVPGKTIEPARSDADVATAKSQAEAALARAVSLHVSGRGDYTPDAATKASWLAVDLSKKPAELIVQMDNVKTYVGKVNDGIRTAMVPVTVEIVDGNERGRSGGQTGTSLDVAAVSGELAGALTGTKPLVVSASLQGIAPGTVYNRSYTHSEAGLQAYVAYATSTQNVRIVVQQLDTPGWSASGRAGESIPSASTYKLFVMLRVFDDVNSGKLTWDTSMLDTTVGGCFERTIVPSTNPCAEEWIRQYGRTVLTNYIHAKGFSSGTGFTFSDAAHTTAGDLAKYLIGLNNGSLVNGNNRSMLLEKMGRQLYRYGIPTGTKGWTQDKVGFLWDYIHDAAIVHNPKGTYVLVIMTKGYSYGYIANVAKQIDTILYP